jgi:hypothetical protein
MTRSMFALVLLMAGISCAAGCHGSRFALWQPGTMQQQQLRATVHDPYTDVNAGPEVVGGRPRDYSQPLPEPVRNRLYVDSL